MKKVVWAVAVLVVLGFGGTAHAAQLPDDDPAPWLLTYPSDLEISYSETGSTGMTLAEMTQVSYDPNWPGMGPNHYWTNSFSGDPYSRAGVVSPTQLSWYSQTWGGDLWFRAATLSKQVCPVTAGRGVEMRCERNTVKFTFSRPVTDPVIHFNNLGANSFADSGSIGNAGDWVDQRLWMHGDSILTLDLAASSYSGSPSLALESGVGNIAVVTDGNAYHLPAGSPLAGAPAITRTADVSVDTTGRPGGHYVGGSFGAGSVRVEGTWTEIVFRRDLLWSFNTYSLGTTPWRPTDGSRQGYSAALQARNECILDQIPAATVYRCDGSGTTWTQNTSADITAAVYRALQVDNPIPEGTSFVITVDEDFGTAPASYDAADGASHVVGDASIGSSASATTSELSIDNSGPAGAVSPNAGGTDADDNAFATAPMLPQSGDYSVSVPLAGISRAAKLCGWIDLDGNGTFETTERSCASVGPGSASANLTWPASSVATVTETAWMRLRLSYDTAGVESPTGRLDSGEVEDWQVLPYSPPPSSSSTSTTAPSLATPSPDATSGTAASTSSTETTVVARAPSVKSQGSKSSSSPLPSTGTSSHTTPLATGVLAMGLVLLLSRRRLSR